MTDGGRRGDLIYRSAVRHRGNAAPLFLVVDMGEMASILPWQKRQPKLLQKCVVLRC
jgi:hypothetical protein